MGKEYRLGLLGALCLFATGCFSYGPYGHPGTFAPPHTAMAPQPYGTTQVPPGTVWVPASPAGTTTLTAPDPVRKSAPTTFEDDHESTGGKSVPVPSDPGKAQPEESDSFGANDDANLDRLGLRTSQRSRPRPLVDEDFSNASASAEPELADSESSVMSDDEPRLPRSRVQTAGFQTQVGLDVVTPASAAADNFGYDTEAYSWLQGIVEFDSKYKVWHLTYSQLPDDSDQFGGVVTLKNPESFKKILHNGRAVSVEGQFDQAQRDRLGKPVYRATVIVPAGTR